MQFIHSYYSVCVPYSVVMEGEVLKSNKKINDKIFFNGEEYIKDGNSVDGSKMYYSCVKYKLQKCTGRLIHYLNRPESEQFVESQPHVHAPDARLVGRATAIDTLKRKAVESTEPTRKLIALSTVNTDMATLAVLPSHKALRRTVLRVRTDENIPTLPIDLNDLILPEEFIKFNGEKFLLHDSGQGEERFLIFCLEQNMQFLKRSDVILMDGTFDIVPPLFVQLYTIQGRINGWYVPLVYILTSSKDAKMYEKVFDICARIQTKSHH